jgi:hypothetical protein
MCIIVHIDAQEKSMNILISSIKPWLGFLFDLLAGQEILRKTPWIDKIFLSIGKRIKQFLDWYSIVSEYEYLLGKINYCFDISLKFFISLIIVTGTGLSLKFPSQLVQYISGAVIVACLFTAFFFLLKIILEFIPKFKSFSKAYLQISFLSMCSLLFLLLIDSQDEKHPFRGLLLSSFPFEANDSMISMALKILGVGSITLASYYLILCPVIGGPSFITSIFLYTNSKLVKVLKRMTNSNVKAVAFVASLFLNFIPD